MKSRSKTLVATLPSYLNALAGHGVHVVTVNDYLARRDPQWMGPIFHFLGLSVGVNLSQMPHDAKKAAYASDIDARLADLSRNERIGTAEKAGLLHHHYPCLASMGKDSDFGDTLMHVSGNILKDNVEAQVKAYKHIQYLAPGTRSE